MTEQRRYSLIDAIRAVAVINMILYHLCFDVFFVFGSWQGFPFAAPAVIWERMISFTFILLSGISMNFSRHGFRRGLIVLLCGTVITGVTVWLTPAQPIWFGVLSFIGCAMLLTAALKRPLNCMKPTVGMAVFFVLFLLCWGIPQRFIGLLDFPLITLPDALYRYDILAPIGFMPEDFFSADYFPLLCWIFLYLFGCQLWRFLAEKGLDRLFLRKIPVLDFIGRHSLIIYMAHQPILYGLCYLILGGSQ